MFQVLISASNKSDLQCIIFDVILNSGACQRNFGYKAGICPGSNIVHTYSHQGQVRVANSPSSMLLGSGRKLRTLQGYPTEYTTGLCSHSIHHLIAHLSCTDYNHIIKLRVKAGICFNTMYN